MEDEMPTDILCYFWNVKLLCMCTELLFLSQIFFSQFSSNLHIICQFLSLSLPNKFIFIKGHFHFHHHGQTKH